MGNPDPKTDGSPEKAQTPTPESILGPRAPDAASATVAASPGPTTATVDSLPATSGQSQASSGGGYISQFSEFSPATQMILKRIRGDSRTLSSALSETVQKTSFQPANYDEVRSRLIANMNTSRTMRIACQSPARLAPGSDTSAANVDDNNAHPALPRPSATGARLGLISTVGSHPDARKRKRGNAGNSDSGGLTGEQKCCLCHRWATAAGNRIKDCDTCHNSWHQLCHDPFIKNEVALDLDKNWTCSKCEAHNDSFRRRRALAGAHAKAKGGLAGSSAARKRAYLSSLPREKLVNLLMEAVQLHPDLPIFPADAHAPSRRRDMPQSLVGGNSTNDPDLDDDDNPEGRINYIRIRPSVAREISLRGEGDAGSGQSTKQPAEKSDWRVWPKPGRGLYSTLPNEDEDDDFLVEAKEHEAHSHVVFDEKGKKAGQNEASVSNEKRKKASHKGTPA